ncbi:MAG: alanine--tRNA ligase [Bacteriovoracaceae bacterium]|nr:alanine--tRNA ligase [Bacteriovoracaceae bacterium]
MKAKEIRQTFKDFFEKHGHKKVSSSSLVPHNDPTLLFCNAGMNQFKDYFTGKAKPEYLRAVTSQKCVRAGGKHNDLENVGFTARHHTFFEMLGNFSFGDYFKKDAIDFAWKLLTVAYKIPKDKLYVTVHKSDQEAADIWHNDQGVPRDRIFYRDDKDNFWEMGETGPCGPCSEIFFDHGPKFSDGKTHATLLDDEMRYVEIWNLVFMQFEKYKEGNTVKMRSLPKPSVDTGAGLERIAAALQSKYWNYDSDLFEPIIKKIEKITKKEYNDSKYQAAMRVIADHIRSSTMLITDGVMPSNEGRGYVLRRIIRRAVRFLNELGVKQNAFHLLVDSVFEVLGHEFPENANNKDLAKKLLEQEEQKFRETLEMGLKHLNEALEKSPKMLKGEEAFKLYDTYGFPIDLTEVILREKNIELDTKGFQDALEKQKERSKKSSKFQIQDDNIKFFYGLKEKFGATDFKGYETLTADAKLLSKSKIEDTYILIFDKTPFYAESGGQVGDIGEIKNKSGTVLCSIQDTQKPVDSLHVHYSSNAESLKENETYTLQVNVEYRSNVAKNHSCTHLLHAALKKVVGQHVNQAGSLVTNDRLRFDFTHSEALSTAQIDKIEDMVNHEIAHSHAVNAKNMKKDEAIKLGAQALFGEKYGETVRVVTMGQFSTELCGGTHVQNISDIGIFKIISESSLSSGVRRLEAATHLNAFEYLRHRSQLLAEVEKLTSSKEEAAVSRIREMQSDIKEKNKSLQQLNSSLQASKSKDLFGSAKPLPNGQELTITKITPDMAGDLRTLSDNYIDKHPKGILFLYSVDDSKITFLARTHKNNTNINFNLLLKDLLPLIEGRGGGRPDMSQGSGAKSSGIDDFISKFEAKLSGHA